MTSYVKITHPVVNKTMWKFFNLLIKIKTETKLFYQVVHSFQIPAMLTLTITDSPAKQIVTYSENACLTDRLSQLWFQKSNSISYETFIR